MPNHAPAPNPMTGETPPHGVSDRTGHDRPPIPVICDRCRAQGLAGEAAFADLGDLLDFDPVPLQVARVDGYSPECQRAFIAALSILGSSHRAAKAIGKSATGAERLRRLPGSEGFCRAWERAKAIALNDGTLRLAHSLQAVAVPNRPQPPQPPPPPEPTADERRLEEQVQAELLHSLFKKYMLKLGQEREARLAGKIALADFYLRQITWFEVVFDLTSEDMFTLFSDFRHRGHHLIDIAETPASQLLDAARRDFWERSGAPPRPEPIRRDLLTQHDGFATEPLEVTWGGLPESHEAQRARFEERHRQAAEEQVEWEARARRDFESRRDSAT